MYHYFRIEGNYCPIEVQADTIMKARNRATEIVKRINRANGFRTKFRLGEMFLHTEKPWMFYMPPEDWYVLVFGVEHRDLIKAATQIYLHKHMPMELIQFIAYVIKKSQEQSLLVVTNDKE